jgi:hypothetical protein
MLISGSCHKALNEEVSTILGRLLYMKY